MSALISAMVNGHVCFQSAFPGVLGKAFSYLASEKVSSPQAQKRVEIRTNDLAESPTRVFAVVL